MALCFGDWGGGLLHDLSLLLTPSQHSTIFGHVKSQLIISVVIILVAFIGIYPYVFDKKIDPNGDNVGYFLLGKGLSQGEGYTSYYNIPARPANHFPPGYPALISTVITLTGASITGIKILSGIIFLLSALVFFFLARRITDDKWAIMISTLLVLISPNLLRYSTIMMSEILYMFLVLTVVWLVTLSDHEKPWYKSWHFWLIILLTAAAYYVRTIGVAILAGLLVYYLFRRRWSYMLALVGGFFLLALPWYLRAKAIGGNSYMSQLMLINPYRPELGHAGIFELFERVWNNFTRYFSREIYASVYSPFPVNYKEPATLLEWGGSAILIAFIVFGFLQLKSHKKLLLGYFSAFMGVLMIWPNVWTGPRFIIPMIPLFILLVVLAIRRLIDLVPVLKKPFKGRLPYVIFLLAAVALAYTVKPQIEKLRRFAQSGYPKAMNNYINSAVWVREKSAPDAVVCCRKPGIFHLFSDRRVTTYLRTKNTELLMRDLEDKGVDYIIIDKLGYSSNFHYLRPLGVLYPGTMRVVHTIKDPDTFVSEYHPELGYTGQFVEEKRQGFGTYRWPDGQCFDGYFIAGKAEGPGVMYMSNGEIVYGNWKQDNLHGQASVYSRTGQLLRLQMYQDGKLINASVPQ